MFKVLRPTQWPPEIRRLSGLPGRGEKIMLWWWLIVIVAIEGLAILGLIAFIERVTLSRVTLLVREKDPDSDPPRTAYNK